MKIKANEATVKTASVEVKTLTISGRQVTLAVFRQLELSSLIDPDGPTLRGIPWGRINYHGAQDCEARGCGSHIHVVWQEGDELRRDSVPTDLRQNMWWQEDMRDYRELWWCGSVLQVLDIPGSVSLLTKGNGAQVLRVRNGEKNHEVEDRSGRIADSLKGALACSGIVDKEGADWQEQARIAVRRMAHEVMFDVWGEAGTAEDVIHKAEDEYKRWGDGYNKIVESLLALDQLFIAV